MNNSIWYDINKFSFEKLDKDLDIDVLIIGGGITGLLTAYYLRNSDLKIALVEQNKLLSGVTSRNTAKLTYLQEDIYSKLEKGFNRDVAKKYLDSQLAAIRDMANIINSEKIKCDLEKVSSYVFTNDSNNIDKLKNERDLLTSFGINVLESNKLPDDYEVKYSISVFDTYVYHPLKFLNKIISILKKSGISIYEDSSVLSINRIGNYFNSNVSSNQVKSKYVVVASHYPYFIKPLFIPFKTTLEKSYIKAFKTDKYYDFSAINIDKPSRSIRYHRDGKNIYKIELVNSHNICIKNNSYDNFKDLIKGEYDYLWSNIDLMTNDYLPYIGSIYDGLYIGTGYNTWGMTNSFVSAKIISNNILGKKSQYDEIFNPNRCINIPSMINFPITLGSNIKSFVGSKINKNKSWYRNVRFDGDKGIYKDDLGSEHIVYNKCPHMGCSLIFNEVEKLWECPCHGSRFDIDGKVVEGPSNYSIKYEDK